MDSKTECIEHKQARVNGYGQTRAGGKYVLLHRKVYCTANHVRLEDIAGKVVRHTCDNRRCINPEHLVLGDHSSNAVDNSLRGARHTKLKLTPAQAYRVKFGTETPAVLSKELGVSQTQVSYIRLGKSWAHITEDYHVS